MPLYKYDSFNRRGSKVKGTIEAPSLQAARQMLRGQGLMPTTISEVSGGLAQESFFASLFEKPVEAKTVILFTKQCTVLLRSGVPLLQAFELMAEQFEGKFKRILINIKEGLKSGQALAKEMGRYPKVFSNVYVQLVRAGEATGKLDQIMQRLTTFLEKDEETRKKIKKAMSYPIMMISFSVLIVIGLLTVLVPRLTGMFTKSGKALPGPTQFLVTSSDFILNHFMVLAGGIVGFIVLFTYWKSTPKGKYKFDELLLRFPLTAYFSRTKAVVQFSKTLGMLIESGVNLSEALDIVCSIVENSVLTQKLRDARDKIIKEGKIAKYLQETGIFPKIASYMISTGEQSGKLGEMLLTVGDDYDVELSELTDGLTAKITPIMTVVMGAIVGFIIVSIFLPIMEMGNISGV
ncbi:MAG: type II secretion system F family protein [bacterium]